MRIRFEKSLKGNKSPIFKFEEFCTFQKGSDRRSTTKSEKTTGETVSKLRTVESWLDKLMRMGGVGTRKVSDDEDVREVQVNFGVKDSPLRKERYRR